MRLRILLLGGLVVLGAACSLNPQPLPPDKPVDGGLYVDANWLGGGNDASEDSTPTTAPPDATVDASFEDASGDAGDASDAADDARGDDGGSDASFDASDDGDGG